MKTSFIQFLLIFSVLSLLFFPQTSVQGAKNGLILWSATITPTLLPFLLLTGFMQYYQTFHLISRLFYPLKKLFPGINEDFFYTCILGFFCGCPLGAKIIDDFISCGSFTKSEGEKLLYTCNQISPMFSAGYTLTLILHGKISALRFFFCLYFPVMCYLIYLVFLFFTSDFLHTGVRDYIHVVDLAKGHVKALKKFEEKPEVRIYNLGTGIGYSVLDVLHAYEEACGKTLPYDIKPRRAGDIATCYCDATKAKEELGWAAEKGIKEMCADSWKWQSMNPDGYRTED